MQKSHLIIISLAVAAIAGCSRQETWRLEGTAPEGVDTVLLQAPKLTGGWYTLDSAVVRNGKFAFSEPRANSSIYRIEAGGKLICVPADSTETLTLDVATGRRQGSAGALAFNAIDSLVSAKAEVREILHALDGQYASIAAYYATRRCHDPKLLRTVANRHKEELPDALRTAVLLDEVKRSLPTSSQGDTQVIYAPEIGYYEVELPDRNGLAQKLSDAVEQHPKVVLAYVDVENGDFPSWIPTLGDVRSSGAEIYMIGFAENQHVWASATANLPWINVYQSDAADRTHIRQYAVGQFPTFFIIKNGEITGRTSDVSTLSSQI